MTKKLRKLSALALVAWASGGCTATFTNARIRPGEDHTAWLSYFLFGAVGNGEVDVRDYCETGRAHQVRFGENALTLGASLITLGIYTPRRVVVTCEASGKEARLR